MVLIGSGLFSASKTPAISHDATAWPRFQRLHCENDVSGPYYAALGIMRLGCLKRSYPLVITNIAMENDILDGKTHYFYGHFNAMLNYQRV